MGKDYTRATANVITPATENIDITNRALNIKLINLRFNQHFVKSY